jgi:hypothetical protein
MSEKKAYRNKHTGKIAYFNDYAYSLVKDSYTPVDNVPSVSSTPKKKEDHVAVDDELEKVRGIWRAIFDTEPNPRKVVKTLQKEIDEFNSEEK